MGNVLQIVSKPIINQVSKSEIAVEIRNLRMKNRWFETTYKGRIEWLRREIDAMVVVGEQGGCAGAVGICACVWSDESGIIGRDVMKSQPHR